MFGIAPRWAHRGDIGVGAFAEAGNAVVLRALGFRVATDHQNLAQLGRLDPGIRKRQVACAAKPEFGALAGLRIHENPAPPAMLGDDQIKAARSEERRVGKEWVSTGRSRWSP